MNEHGIFRALKFKDFDTLLKIFQEMNKYKESTELEVDKNDNKKIFKIGEYIIYGSNYEYGKILKFFCLNLKNNKNLYLIKVQKFLDYSIINNLENKEIKEVIFKQEIFSTTDEVIIELAQIHHKIQVAYGIIQYQDEMDKLNDNDAKDLYYTRANYDIKTNQFDPPFSEWESNYCICDVPDNLNAEYIQCNKCNKWYHYQCVNLTYELYEHFKDYDEEYICIQCKDYKDNYQKKQSIKQNKKKKQK